MPEAYLFKEGYRDLSGDNFSWADSGFEVSVIGAFENASVTNDWRNLDKRDGIDRGSNWTMFKSLFEPSPHRIKVQCRLTAQHYTGYDGPVIVHSNRSFGPEDFSELIDFAATEDGLNALGTTAISRCLPTNPISDLPVAVAELFSEGLPQAIGAQIKRGGRVTPALLSGEYLNSEFGIKPFIADLLKFREATLKADRLIAQFRRDSGKLIRRGYRFPDRTETYIVDHGDDGGYGKWLGGPLPSMEGFLTPVLDGYSGTRVDVNTVVHKRWFKGAFTYYIPSSKDLLSRVRREEAEIRHLYGGITANTIWNLLPWSWAADWFTNAGDVIQNISAFANDGLVMPYGYIMEHCELHSYRTVTGARFGRMVEPDVIDLPPISNTYSAVFKRRRKATPFGFGIEDTELTNRQYAIATALGLSRGGLR
jgi:hypothetical protein